MDNKNLIFFAPSLEDGGVEKNLKMVANNLSNKFSEISLITFDNIQKKDFNKKINFILPKRNFLNSNLRKFKFISCSYLLFKSLLRNRKQTVISFQGNVYSIIVCKLLFVKIIIRSNVSPIIWKNNLSKLIFYKFIYSFADKIIVNSKNFQLQMKSLLNLKTICIYNPLDKNKILSLSKKKINVNFFEKKRINILHVGRLVKQKNQKCLINALTDLKNTIPFKLIIIGKGNNKKYLENLVKKNNMSNFIKFLPYKKNPYPYFIKSDLFILTSLYEGSPNVLTEAILLKNCIISSDCSSGPSEILLNGKGGLLFKNDDYEDLKKKILYLFKNREICNKKKRLLIIV